MKATLINTAQGLKKLALATVIMLGSKAAFAQGPEVTTAILSMREKDMPKAFASIEAAAKKPKFYDTEKYIFTRGEIYYRMLASEREELVKLVGDTGSVVCAKMFQKVVAMGNKSSDYYKGAESYLPNAWVFVINRAVELQNEAVDKKDAKLWEKAFNHFELATQLKSRDTMAYVNGSYAAYQFDRPDLAKTMMEKQKNILRRVSFSSYLYGIQYFRSKNDKPKLMAFLDEAIAAFPTNKALQAEKLNVLLDGGNTKEIIEQTKVNLEKDPSNSYLYYVLGNMYEKMAADDKANYAAHLKASLENYQSAYKLDPNNGDYNYNLGVYFYNRGKLFNDTTNNWINYKAPKPKPGAKPAKAVNQDAMIEKYKKLANEQFVLAKPYFEMVYKLNDEAFKKEPKANPKDDRILSTLLMIYGRLGDQASMKKMEEELKKSEAAAGGK